MALASGNGEMIQQQWFPDERDGFIMWLRGEFVAANAMIDSLCEHLKIVGDQGEYDGVVTSINDRRCNWHPLLHMQHFFSISEVINALQQVAWKKQQQRGIGKDFKRNGSGINKGHRGEFFKGNSEKKGEKVFENGVVASDHQGFSIVEDKKEINGNIQEDSCIKKPLSPQGTISHNSEADKPRVNCEGHSDVPQDNNLHSIQNLPVKQNVTISPKTFVANEIQDDGKTVNVVDGMKLYDEVLDISEINKIIPLVNEMRAAGKKGDLQGNTFVWSKRPMKGHGREMIQLGLSDARPEHENATGDQNMLPIPQLLKDVIDRLVSTQLLTVKPDSCFIDVFYEGDFSQPQMWPSWYGRPVSVLFLTESEITFGKFIGTENPGDYNGSLKLSLQPGSLLVMQGNSANLAKYAMSSIKKQRILITFTKIQSKKPTIAPVPHWGPPPPSQSPILIRHPIANDHRPIPANGVLPPQQVRPVFMPPPVHLAMPFPAPVAVPVQPRIPLPRVPVPGTGVFLPPGSSNSSSPSSTVTDKSFSAESEKENGILVNNNNESKMGNKSNHKECNGSSKEEETSNQ